MKLVEVLVDDLERIQLFFNALHWLGVGVVSIGVLGFGLSLRGRGGILTPSRIAVLSIIPGLSVVGWLGDPRVVDLLVSSGLPFVVVSGFEAVEATWPWFRWVSLFYLWGVTAIGSLFILETALERPKLDLSRGLLGIMVAVPLTINLLYEFNVIANAQFDPTVFGFVVTGVAGLATVDRFRLFDVPFARAQIVEEFSTPVLVYGRHNQLYDYNQRAADILGIGPTDLDEDIRAVLGETALPFPEEALDRNGDVADALDGTQVAIPLGDSDTHYFQINVSALDRTQTTLLGHTIQLTDITDQQRQYEQTRKERDLKEFVRSILVRLSSRDAIEQAVCDQLVSDDQYSFAWIGEYTTDGEFTLRTCTSGSEVEIDREQYEPTKRIKELGLDAQEADEIPVLHATPEAGDLTVQDALAKQGVQTVVLIPLTYNDLSYGILGVYTARSDTVESNDRGVLGEVGESVAFAIHAAERREAVQGEQVREVRFRITDADHYLMPLARSSHVQHPDARIEGYEVGADTASEFSSPNTDAEPETHRLHFLTVRGMPTESVVEHLTTHPDVQSVTQLETEGDTVSLRVLVRPPSLGSLVAEAGGVVQTIRVVTDSVEAVAEFSPRTDIAQVLDHVRTVYPEIAIQSLVTKAPEKGRMTDSPVASLTDKQRQALEAAYHSGFFERPQRQTADEIAATLDVSRSTFLSHLRTAENTVLTDLLTNSE